MKLLSAWALEGCRGVGGAQGPGCPVLAPLSGLLLAPPGLSFPSGNKCLLSSDYEKTLILTSSSSFLPLFWWGYFGEEGVSPHSCPGFLGHSHRPGTGPRMRYASCFKSPTWREVRESVPRLGFLTSLLRNMTPPRPRAPVPQNLREQSSLPCRVSRLSLTRPQVQPRKRMQQPHVNITRCVCCFPKKPEVGGGGAGSKPRMTGGH